MDAVTIIGGLLLAGWALKKIGDRSLSRSSDGNDGDVAGRGVGALTDSVSSIDGSGYGHGGHGGGGHGGGGGGHGGGH